jgi:hypothetical protein
VKRKGMGKKGQEERIEEKGMIGKERGRTENTGMKTGDK